VSEYGFNVDDVFCFVVFHCSFPMSEGVKVDAFARGWCVGCFPLRARLFPM